MQGKSEALLEREREMMDLRTTLEGKNADLTRDITDKNKVRMYTVYTSNEKEKRERK